MKHLLFTCADGLHINLHFLEHIHICSCPPMSPYWFCVKSKKSVEYHLQVLHCRIHTQDWFPDLIFSPYKRKTILFCPNTHKIKTAYYMLYGSFMRAKSCFFFFRLDGAAITILSIAEERASPLIDLIWGEGPMCVSVVSNSEIIMIHFPGGHPGPRCCILI